jgi:hypothetical protein
MTMTIFDRILTFNKTALEFDARRATDVFAKKNNKTLEQTLLHAKYARFASVVREKYPHWLPQRLGVFLIALKQADDPFYLEFLNRYGDGCYCVFHIKDPKVLKLKGLYCYTVGQVIKYIGKSTDSFGKRINQGYGRIHPKNCCRDGQSTNCHLNALIATNVDGVSLFVCPMVDDAEIDTIEAALIAKLNPEWNIQLRASSTGAA